jgi:hypothetical protein
MIKFFRHIRKTLIEQNQMGKYFRYAIGEIILVVIGILIALQINNWNERRQDQEKLEAILIKIKEDLTADLFVAKNNLNYLKRKDSIAQLIFNETIDIDTFSKIGGSFLPFSSIVLDMNTTGFDQFQQNIDKVPKDYKELIIALNEIYINTKSNLEIYNLTMDETISKDFTSLSKTKSWFSDWSRNIPSKEADAFFLRDSTAKNLISLYLQNLDATAIEGFNFKQRAIKAIKLIDSLTIGQSQLPDIANNNLKDDGLRTRLTGTYMLIENKDKGFGFETAKLQIIEKEDALVMVRDSNTEVTLYFNHGLTFIGQPGFISFIKNEKGDIELQIQRRSGQLTYQKI